MLCGVGTTRWRVAINARSDVAPSEVAQAVIERLRAPDPRPPARLNEGWHRLRADGLDYIRGGLCRPEQFTPLPLSKPGADNDLNELFDRHLPATRTSTRSASPGARTTPRTRTSASRPGAASTTSTPNQGNLRQFRRDDGVWQDGGLIVGAGGGWTAILLRFQSQSWKTDDRTGHAR